MCLIYNFRFAAGVCSVNAGNNEEIGSGVTTSYY